MCRILRVLRVLFWGVLMVGLINISCNTDKKPKTIIVDEKTDEPVDYNKTDSSSEVKFSETKNQEIYDSYLSIKKALVNSKGETVQLEAKKLEASIRDLEKYSQLRATSKLIALTKDIKKQRDFFVALTDEVEKQIEKSNIQSGEVYKQFCPMAFDGEGGYWLSDSKEVRNPYFGNKMLVCGSVEKVFK